MAFLSLSAEKLSKALKNTRIFSVIMTSLPTFLSTFLSQVPNNQHFPPTFTFIIDPQFKLFGSFKKFPPHNFISIAHYFYSLFFED